MSSPPPTAQTGADAADLTRLAGLKLGNYRLERLVGRGRMGAVYLAKDEALLRPTAVKILSWRIEDGHGQDPVQWFLSEARLVARINHPRVVQIYGAARQGAHCYIAMEYVPGRSAGTAVAQDGPMAPEAATDVLVQAASALSAAHRSGVIHRDVKPANLLMGTGGVTKLGDFGMALGLSDHPAVNAHLRVGTPYYTAPEIWRGQSASPASDIYSLGATYFHLLTGSPPFTGNDVAAVEQGHLQAPVPDPRDLVPGIPEPCAALVRRALAKSPRERQASAQELAWEGRRVLQELAMGATSPPLQRRLEAGGGVRGEGPAPEREDPPPAPAVVPAWARELRLARTPFAAVDPAAPPYLGEPFSSLAALLVNRIDDEGTAVVSLTGAEGSGRTAFARRVAAELAPTRLVVFLDVGEDPGGRELLPRLGRALGGVGEQGAADGLEEMVERLEEERRRRGRRALVVVDGVALASPPLLGLLRAAAVTRSFKAMLVGAGGLPGALARGGLEPHVGAVAEIEVPPLQGEQIPAYARSWLAACMGAHAPLLFSPDALRLLALRSAGNLRRINRIAENMLVMAAARRRRVLTTFEAWTASERDPWAALPSDGLPSRPEGWPTPEARNAIDACRKASGIPPWPRAEEAEPGVPWEPSASRTPST